MKQELVRQIVRVGNSAGVILPKEWLNGKARIELIEKPLNIRTDVLGILEFYLEDVIGIYLAGSYARGEENKESDVDILVITRKTNKRINSGKYEITLISKDRMKNALEKNALPIIPMLLEAKTLLNEELIENYRKESALNRTNLKSRIELCKSALAIDREMIKLDEEWPSNCSDAVAYSLVLNLRAVYIVDKLGRGKMPSVKELKSLIIKICGSLLAYEGYLRVKKNKRAKEELPVGEAKKLYEYVVRKLREIEAWLKEKKD